MTEQQLRPEDVANWQGWIGRSEERSEILDAGALRRYAAAIGEDIDVERTPPSLAHWAFFLPLFGDAEIGLDGHPQRGGFLPPISLPRRMFAAADMRFDGALALNREARRVSTIRDVKHRSGRSGELILVEVEHRVVQDDVDKVVETQTIVYRDAGEPTAPIEDKRERIADATLWQPTPVNLFRFSAVTFNSHRIHYDLPYATAEEGYPGLVIHGPFTAARLFGHARGDAAATGYSFRAVAPLFAPHPVQLVGGDGEVSAIRCDGVTAMTASMRF